MSKFSAGEVAIFKGTKDRTFHLAHYLIGSDCIITELNHSTWHDGEERHSVVFSGGEVLLVGELSLRKKKPPREGCCSWENETFKIIGWRGDKQKRDTPFSVEEIEKAAERLKEL